jgi:hypothetical protein
MQTNPGERWFDTNIDNPERFGFDGTLKSARAAASVFILNGSSDG